MKFFAFFAAILALTAAAPLSSEWNLHEISAALENPSTDPALIPYLEHALNQIMDALHAGFQIDSVAIPLPADVISPVPAVVEETWTLQEISAALQDPSTNPALIPYLEQALNEMMDAIYAGVQVDSVAIPLPADVITPVPVAVEESAPAPVEAAPAAVPTPLVQIIINVNKQGEAAVVPSPVPSPALVPVVNPTPVAVVEEPINPTPVAVVDEVAEPIVPTPVVVVEEVAEEIPVNPVDVIEVHPEAVLVPAEINPIDVIAVGAPEVNPVDILHPIPVNPAGEVGSIIV